MRSTLIVKCFLLASLAVAAGCSKKPNANTILLGEYSSLTGTTATFGQSSHKGLKMAIDEINESGGVLGKKIKLITEDTQSKPEEAASAVTKLISRDNVKAIVGEFASSRSLAGAPTRCRALRVPSQAWHAW